MTGTRTASRTRRLSATRAALHDLVCESDHCQGDNDHAKRTQHTNARRIVDGGYDTLVTVVHEVACHPHCMRDPAAHVNRDGIARLAARLGIDTPKGTA